MKKALPVRDWKGNITLVYFLENSTDLVVKENTFNKFEWNKGIAKWQWEQKMLLQMGEDYEIIGKETKELGGGYLYQLHFAKKITFVTRKANDIIEEYITQWQQK